MWSDFLPLTHQKLETNHLTIDKAVIKLNSSTRFLATEQCLKKLYFRPSSAISAAVLSALLTLTAPQISFAQDTVVLNFVNTDIASVVGVIGKQTGKNFIIDPRVTGNMNIISQTPVNKDVAYQILLSALRVHGFAAIEERGVIKIVPEAEAKTSATVIDRGTALGGSGAGDKIITQVFSLQNESAAQLATVLRPLVAPNNYIGAYPGNNTLVITDYASNVARVAKVIAAIDIAPSQDIQAIKLQHASAIDLATTINKLMPETQANTTTPGASPKLTVAVEPRTNSLLLRADSPALITRVRALVASIDTPTANGGNIHVVYLRNAEALKIADALRSVMSTQAAATAPPGSTGAAVNTSSGSVQAYPASNSLVIVASDYVYNNLRSVIEKLDQRRKQVHVEVLVVEVTSSVASELGIQWQDLSGVNKTGTAAIGGTNFGVRGTGVNIIDTATSIATVGQGLNLGFVRGKLSLGGVEVLNLGALIRALGSDQRANILATPNIMTLDNEEAKFVSGQNVPFVTGSFTATGTGTTSPFQTIERRDVGLTLKVTPQVAEGGAIKLKVFQELSSVTAAGIAVKSADIITTKRAIESTVLVDDGDTVVIGGLISDDTKNADGKVPFFGDLPLIGNLFRSQTKSRDKTNLMIFLRPVIVGDAKTAAQVTGERYDYIRNQQTEFNNTTATTLAPLEPNGSAQIPVLEIKPKAETKPLTTKP